MPDIGLVLALESRLVNAWPSFEIQLADGWILRFAGGYSKRANAATPLRPGAGVDDDLVQHVLRAYSRQGIRPTFRLTGVEAPEVDARLAAHGLVEIEPTYGMVAPLEGVEEMPLDESVAIEPTVSRDWVREAATAYGGDKADDALLVEIVSRIRQRAGFATLSLDDRPVAWGLGVIERGYVGLYDIVVAPDLKGIGLGRRTMLSLMAWGRANGARFAYLQVREENEVARSLYRSLGFSDAYRYTHRVTPAPAGA